MAGGRHRKPAKPFRDLSPSHQKRLLRYFEREHGWDRRQVAGRYNRGTLPGLSAARGHEVTPEHGGTRRGGRTLWVFTQQLGVTQIEHLNQRERRLVGLHWNWVRHFEKTGDDTMWSVSRQREISPEYFDTKTVGEEKYHLEINFDYIGDASLTGDTDIGDELYEDLEA